MPILRIEDRDGIRSPWEIEAELNLPDETGSYETPLGQITINTDSIGQNNMVQPIIIKADVLKGRRGSNTEEGRRVVDLSPNGMGATMIGRNRILRVRLENCPIRVSSYIERSAYDYAMGRGRVLIREHKYLSSHPRWMK